MGRKRKSLGLGDTVEKITEATGIKSVVKFLAGEDCGCEERKQKLNKLFPYKKTNCLTESDYNYLTAFFNEKTVELSVKKQREIAAVYFNVFNVDLTMSSCSSCWRDYISQLKKVYNEYNFE